MSVRKQRLADEIRDLVASCFQAEQLADPRLKYVTITAVKLTGDLQLGSVYFRLMQGDDAKSQAAAKAGLESATGYLRRRLAEALDIRRVPNLRFFYDESIERGSRIEGLLSQLD